MILVDGVVAHPPLAADLAFTHGFAVYEALRTYGGRPFAWDVHLQRLRNSAAWCGLADWPDAVWLRDLDLARQDLAGELKLLLYITGSGRRVLSVAPLAEARVGAPVRLASLAHSASAALPGWVKHTSRMPWEVAARQAGVDEVLLTTPQGEWLEASKSAILAVRDGRLFTPAADGRILASVTLQALRAAARAAGPASALLITAAPLWAGPVDELWVASTLKGLAPVSALDGQPLPTGGPVGTALQLAFTGWLTAEGQKFDSSLF